MVQTCSNIFKNTPSPRAKPKGKTINDCSRSSADGNRGCSAALISSPWFYSKALQCLSQNMVPSQIFRSYNICVYGAIDSLNSHFFLKKYNLLGQAVSRFVWTHPVRTGNGPWLSHSLRACCSCGAFCVLSDSGVVPPVKVELLQVVPNRFEEQTQKKCHGGREG